jgi:glutathione S-transferase
MTHDLPPAGDPKEEAPLPVLYSFRRCPYAMRARWALVVSGQVCELREVLLRDKPAELLAASPKGTVPVLVDVDGAVIDQSLEIMLWALKRNDPQAWLQPSAGTLQEMRELIAACDGDFKRDLDAYKYPGRAQPSSPEQPVDPTSARERSATFLVGLEGRLRHGRWLHGEHMSLSDAAIAPFVRQFAAVDAAWFNAQPWPGVRGWLQSLVGSEMFTALMVRHPRWQPGQARVCMPVPGQRQERQPPPSPAGDSPADPASTQAA